MPPPSAPLVEESPPRYLLLSSTGGAAERWSSKLGLYTLDTRCPGPRVYTQAEDVQPGHQHQLRCEAGVWGVTSSADTSYPYLRTKTRDTSATSSPTNSQGWQYWVDYGVYRDDALLTAVALTQPPPACSLTLGCVSPPRDLAHPEVVGEYRDTGQHHLGRSLLSHAHHHALHLLVDTYWGWVVETQPGSGDHIPRCVPPRLAGAGDTGTRRGNMSSSLLLLSVVPPTPSYLLIKI